MSDNLTITKEDYDALKEKITNAVSVVEGARTFIETLKNQLQKSADTLANGASEEAHENVITELDDLIELLDDKTEELANAFQANTPADPEVINEPQPDTTGPEPGFFDPPASTSTQQPNLDPNGDGNSVDASGQDKPAAAGTTEAEQTSPISGTSANTPDEGPSFTQGKDSKPAETSPMAIEGDGPKDPTSPVQ